VTLSLKFSAILKTTSYAFVLSRKWITYSQLLMYIGMSGGANGLKLFWSVKPICAVHFGHTTSPRLYAISRWVTSTTEVNRGSERLEYHRSGVNAVPGLWGSISDDSYCALMSSRSLSSQRPYQTRIVTRGYWCV
jgi:hypothetical protein